MLGSDIPISDVHDDEFNRLAFAESLAKALTKADISNGGFVAAITGSWGAGKSTTINFVLHYVRQIAVRKAYETLYSRTPPTELEFDEVHREFLKYKPRLDDLESNNFNSYKRPHRAIKAEMEDYSIPDNMIDPVFDYMMSLHHERKNRDISIINFSPWALRNRSEVTTSLLHEIGNSIKKSFDQRTQKKFTSYFDQFCQIASATGYDFGMGKVLGKISRFFSSSQERGLIDLKRELSNLLISSNNSKKRIVVVIDDLDRLTPEEVSELIGALKGVANLPRVFYLLSYDREELGKVLSKSVYGNTDNSGHKFLEKIIQYSKELPTPSNEQLSNFFEKRLLTILEENNVTSDPDRLSTSWLYAIQIYLNTPRDAVRLLNNFAVSFSSIHGITEHNDLLLITTLETFEPNVYSELKKYIFKINRLTVGEDAQDSLVSSVEQANNKGATEQALALLMPSLKAASKYITQKPPKSFRDKALVFSAENARENYFNLNPDISPIPSEILKNISPDTPPNGTFVKAVEHITKDGALPEKCRALLQTIATQFFGNDLPLTIEWAIELKNTSEFLMKNSAERTSALLSNSDDLAKQSFENGLSNLQQEEQFKILKEIINISTDISFSCDVVRRICGDLRKEGHNGSSSLSSSQGQILRDLLQKKIESLQKDGNLIKQISFRHVMWFWWGTNSTNELNSFLLESLKSDEHAEIILESLIGKSFTSNGTFDLVRPDTLETLGGSNIFIEASKRLEKSGNKQQRALALRFSQAVKYGKANPY
ncbi:KAP family P-loop NTPase fold protein [Thalassospira povalilytica]|uniref:KAP NTPase domain-containing protein n=1 Tax=Thalassospira povalilytica TaxID=732237 RepID=A0A8I1M8Z8_9PROT|nr:P-loop NTPase fold protein [Thalassospira povalilytica]MBN8197593.1 hypothetical protein [Thalassospira povalilytica]